MKTKKTEKANLEKKRGIFLQIGFILALGLCLAAFEWSSEEVDQSTYGSLEMTSDFEEEIMNTYEEPPPVEDEPLVEEPELVIEELIIKDDKEKVDKIIFNSDVKKKNDFIIKVEEPEELPKEKLDVIEFVHVEVKPLYPGGDAALLKYLSDHTKYPEIPKENNVQGKVYIKFVISENGKVIDASIAQGVDPYLDAEALRVVSTLPNWEPGKQRDQAVPVSFILPINFKLY